MFITNYIKGHKAYTTYRNHTSKQRPFKTGVPQDGVLSPTPFNIYTSGLPPPTHAPVQVMAYADDITSTSTSAAKKYNYTTIHTESFCLDKTKQSHTKSRQINLHSVHARPCRIYELDLTIDNKALPMATHPKVLGLTLDPKLTYSTHIHNISVQAHKPLQIIKHSLQQDGVNRRKHSWLPIKQL